MQFSYVEHGYVTERLGGLKVHTTVDLGPWGGGACQLITRSPDGVLCGGADPRPGSVALGFFPSTDPDLPLVRPRIPDVG